jgi:hypothetical protein
MRFRSVTSIATALVASLSLSLATLAATPAVAHADEDPATRLPLVPTPPPEGSQAEAPATTRSFYGWQNLGVDAASIALLALSLDADDDVGGTLMASVGLGGYLFGSPLVHALHGHGERAAGSFALRLGVPVGLGALTWAVEDHPDCDNNSEWFCGFSEAIMPVFVGMLGAGAVVLADDFGLAYDEKPAAPRFVPTFQASHGGMTFGLAGTF